MAMLEEIVRTDNKQRYSFNDDKTKIRANQGHSIPVDVELEQKTPPDVLWHGTGEKYVSSIEAEGLIPKTRLYVHLSSDPDTAIKVGSRHGKPVVYEVAAKEMQEDGYVFFQSVNGVWLTKHVPTNISKMPREISPSAFIIITICEFAGFDSRHSSDQSARIYVFK